MPRDFPQRDKALKILGTSESKMVLTKVLGITTNELEQALEEALLLQAELIRKQNDEKILMGSPKRAAKGFIKLGLNPSATRLEKRLGLSAEELAFALKETEEIRLDYLYNEEFIERKKALHSDVGLVSGAEKNAIVESEKLQQIFGVNPRLVRLMGILGATEEQIFDLVGTNEV